MSDSHINIAIAEVDGWKFENGNSIHPWGLDQNDGVTIPDYLNDLNAVHRVETMAHPHHLATYNATLLDVMCSARTSLTNIWVWHATARQRCEAILRTLNKWEETK